MERESAEQSASPESKIEPQASPSSARRPSETTAAAFMEDFGLESVSMISDNTSSAVTEHNDELSLEVQQRRKERIVELEKSKRKMRNLLEKAQGVINGHRSRIEKVGHNFFRVRQNG